MSQWLWQVFQRTSVVLGAPLLSINNAIAMETSAVPTVAQHTEVLPTREVKLANSSVPQSLPNSDTETIPNQNGILEQIEQYQKINSAQQKLTQDLFETKAISNQSELLEQIEQYQKIDSVNQELTEDSIWQVNNVNQLRDVTPEDWAYEALRSLVERYGCIVGFPEQTFHGNRNLTRWEFATGLNACLEKIERLIVSSETVLQEDLETLQRLVQEYEAELAALGTRVNNLEGRVAFLEDHQFSTTTKFTGQVFTYLSSAWRGGDLKAEGASVFNAFDPPRDENNRPRRRIVDSNPQATLSYYSFLRFNTSFYGEDSLVLQLAAGNIARAPANDLLSAGFLNSSGTPFALQTGTPNPNQPVVHELYYDFSVVDNLRIVVGPRIQVYKYFDGNRFTYFINGADSFNSSGSTQFSAIDRGSGAIIAWDINETFKLTTGYVGNNTEFLPPAIGSSASDPRRGLFGGTYNIMAELDIAPTDNLNLRFLYTRNRLEAAPEGVNKGLVGGAIGEPIPYGLADDGFGGELRHAFGDVFLFNFDWLVTDGFGLFGRYSYGSTDLTPRNPDRKKGEINSQSLQLGFAFPDLGKEGAQGTFSYLIPFSILDGREFLVSGGGDGGVGYEFELNYFYPITDNIAISPSFYVVMNPNNFDGNDPIYVSNFRLQFDF